MHIIFLHHLFVFIFIYRKCFTCIYSALNEADVHGNGTSEDMTDNEQRVKISNATIPYLEQLHKLLLDPPVVNITEYN